MFDEKLTDVDVAPMRRQMQRSVRPKERKKEKVKTMEAMMRQRILVRV